MAKQLTLFFIVSKEKTHLIVQNVLKSVFDQVFGFETSCGSSPFIIISSQQDRTFHRSFTSFFNGGIDMSMI